MATWTSTRCARCSRRSRRLAEGPVAESFANADRNPPVFDPDQHTITVPGELAKSVQAAKDAEWWRVGIPEGIGGVPAPRR